ncbi:MAG: carbohydrate kinase family protein [Gemmatimonadales bacterium]
MPQLGVVGSLVWDEIHGRDTLAAPVEEWGGIAYALAGLDAALAPDWQVVPLIKVGRDLAQPAAKFLGTLQRLVPGGRCAEVPVPNNRVVLRYTTGERRCERMSGGVPGWGWDELGPMVRDLDALYLNFISGFEMGLGTAESLRRGFGGPVYADLHSLFLGMGRDGIRAIRPLPDAPGWFGCFDYIQMNEDEMSQLGADPMVVAADVVGAGARALIVTLSARGAVYFGRAGGQAGGRADEGSGAIATALVPAPAVEVADPTGCGDVFGAVACARLLAGDPLPEAVRMANELAARNATFRGASGLAAHLRGEIQLR